MNRAVGERNAPTIDWKGEADALAEAIRWALLDLGFHKRDVVTDAVVDRLVKALSRHKEVTS
jgi:hypothetical protein